MKCVLYVGCCIFPFLAQAQDNSLIFDESTSLAIQNIAENGDPNHQLIMGLIYEIEGDCDAAFTWYILSAGQGNLCAEKHLGILSFLGLGTMRDKVQGMALILRSSMGSDMQWKALEEMRLSMLLDMTMEELNASITRVKMWYFLEHQPARTNAKPISCGMSRSSNKSQFSLISDRPDPQDANERVYGPGTYEGNRGFLKSDYETLEKGLTELSAKLNSLENKADWMKIDAVRERIKVLLQEANTYQNQALKDLAAAVLFSIEAGVSITIPPASVLGIYLGIGHFKSAAENYNQSISIKEEAQKLLEIERSQQIEKERNANWRE